MAESPKRRKCKDNPYTLNYIEMGLSTSIAFALYKPLDENNRADMQKLVDSGWASIKCS